jgi:hypothetical protein
VLLKPGADWEVLQVNPLNEGVNATPAFVDGKVYIRTHENLYCFAKRS